MKLYLRQAYLFSTFAQCISLLRLRISNSYCTLAKIFSSNTKVNIVAEWLALLHFTRKVAGSYLDPEKGFCN
jgi:hypothetical protein